MNRKDYVELIWSGKEQAIKESELPTNKKLITCEEESKDFYTTQNLYIEGDNLDALKLLKKEYQNKIKMIYIDPPYNTGNKFIYSDNLSHADWLNMIYPRLKLARDLLTDDGVIFISIDDNEQANLKKVCDEIFGEGNFVGCLKWKRKKQPSFLSRHIAPLMEYIFIYSRKICELSKLSIESVSDETKKVINISNQSSERIFKPGIKVKGLENGSIEKGVYTITTMSVEYKDTIIIKDGITQNRVRVVAKFLNTQEKIDEFINNNLLFITANKGLRRYLSEEERNKEKSITDLILDWGDNQDSEKEQRDIFGDSYFDYAKPVLLLFNLSKSCTNEDSLILDFFSGSATTAHAVMKLNAEDGGHRKFIMVQLPEVCDETSEAYKAGYKNICEIGKERIRRAGQKIKDESPLTTQNLDVGFRVLKIVDKD